MRIEEDEMDRETQRQGQNPRNEERDWDITQA